MKQFFVMLAFLSSLWLSGTAREVSAEQARQKAFSFLKTNKRAAEGAKFVGKSVNEVRLCYTSTQEEMPNFYVFNTGTDGFVIVSAEDRTPEILGYSTNGQFDENNMPDAMRELLQSYEVQIAAISAEPEPQTRATRATFSGTKVIETAQWGQDEPYNTYCPADCPTGCMATATAIIMKHYGYPTTGRGSHSYQVPYTGETLSVDFSTRTYDWASMPMQNATNSSDANYYGVARLMADIGIATEMDYTPEASAANISSARNVLVDNLMYSPKARIQRADDFAAVDWSKKLCEEIDNDRLILYAGSSDVSAHAFVVDGYGDDLFSINWGWGGYCNGFFSLGKLQPDESSYHYNFEQMAILNIMPSDGFENHVSPMTFYPDAYGYCGFVSNGTDVRKGEPFSIMTGPFYNFGADTYSGMLYVALLDREGEVKSLLSEGITLNQKPNWGYSRRLIDCIPSVDAVEDDYIVLVTQATGSDEYQLICDRDMTLYKLPATGYTPPTATVTYEHRADVAVTPYDSWNFLYRSRPVVGAPYYFKVQAPEDVVKVVARYRNRIIPYSDEYDVFMIERLMGDESVAVKAYTQSDLIPSLKVHVEEAGTLEEALQERDPDAIRSIVVSGYVDQRDFAFLNKYFTDIDMRDATVVAYGSYPANEIPRKAFEENDRLTRFIMPAGITSIGSNAFMETALTEVVIPKGVVRFGLNVFNYCQQLKEVTVLNPEPAFINWCVLIGTLCDQGGTLHVPVGAKAAYEAADEWNQFTNIVEDAKDIYDGIKSVGATKMADLFSLNGNTLTSTTGKKLNIYDLTGRQVARGTSVTLKSGAYIVVRGNTSAKVFVK